MTPRHRHHRHCRADGFLGIMLWWVPAVPLIVIVVSVLAAADLRLRPDRALWRERQRALRPGLAATGRRAWSHALADTRASPPSPRPRPSPASPAARSPPRSWSAPAWRASTSWSRRSAPGPSSTASMRWRRPGPPTHARREGKGVGPLNGLPVGVKDIIDTADMPTEHGCAGVQGAASARGCGVRHGAAPRRRRHPRQDRDDGARSPQSRGHAQSPQRRAYARRLLLGLRCGGRLRHGAGGARHADRGLRHPPVRLLRRLRVQADVRDDPPHRRADARALARHGRRHGPVGGGRRAARRRAAGLRRGRSREPVDEPPAPARHRHRGLAAAHRCSRSSRRTPGAIATPPRTRPSASSSRAWAGRSRRSRSTTPPSAASRLRRPCSASRPPSTSAPCSIAPRT